ncbi:transcriptional regulatory protein BaeR [Geobacter sp. OR-1]|uniref:response regulator transcription factor n=1 Tax=Geobacter sp. OR-1 TaxID=1266765 RepID=UPI00054362A2|nr:response regulator transcription factor [Geobacter sp. OR-1]GAM08331.1 transcriptional regulatory protein BaeR [Geobacter sp. OR-1]
MPPTDYILLVEDDISIAEVVTSYLTEAGYHVSHHERGQHALDHARKESPMLVVLDLSLPDVPGELVCQELKRLGDIPVIMLTAKSSEEQRLIGFSLGADDYVVKPFSARELVFRVKVALKRTAEVPADTTTGKLSFNGKALILDPECYQVIMAGTPVELSATEFKMLLRIASTPGKVFSREELLEKVLGYTCEGYDRCIDAHIKNIRHKIGDRSKNPVYIESVYGVGYRFNGVKDT